MKQDHIVREYDEKGNQVQMDYPEQSEIGVFIGEILEGYKKHKNLTTDELVDLIDNYGIVSFLDVAYGKLHYHQDEGVFNYIDRFIEHVKRGIKYDITME